MMEIPVGSVWVAKPVEPVEIRVTRNREGIIAAIDPAKGQIAVVCSPEHFINNYELVNNEMEIGQ